MKKLLISSILLICVTVLSAQHNEISISSKLTYKSFLEKGIALSYFRSITAKSALGVRVNYQNNTQGFILKNRPTIDLDLSNRWNLLRSEKVRLLAEVGSTVRREYHVWSDPLFCGFGEIVNGRNVVHSSYYQEYWTTSVLATFRLGMDFRLFKFFRLGLGYDARTFIFRNNNENGGNLQSSAYFNVAYIF